MDDEVFFPLGKLLQLKKLEVSAASTLVPSKLKVDTKGQEAQTQLVAPQTKSLSQISNQG